MKEQSFQSAIVWQIRPWVAQVAYEPMRAEMQALTLARTAEAPDELWPLEHLPVFTQGLAGDPSHVLAAGSIPVVRTERGGQVTYHGPGQLVVYVLVDLNRRQLKVRELVSALEQALIDTLATWGLVGERRPGAPGVYLRGVPGSPPEDYCKVAALGLKVSRGCSWHGLALNIDMDLSPYDQINPCGYAGLRTIDLATVGCRPGREAVQEVLLAAIQARIDEASISP